MLRALPVDGRLLGTVHALGVSRPSADSTVLLIDSLVSMFGVMETYTIPVLIISKARVEMASQNIREVHPSFLGTILMSSSRFKLLTTFLHRLSPSVCRAFKKLLQHMHVHLLMRMRTKLTQALGRFKPG